MPGHERYNAIGAGVGHGLAAAYFLAKNHGITNVALLESGGIGGANPNGNTTIIPFRILAEALREAFQITELQSHFSQCGMWIDLKS